jgi:thioesterase domain-containing protein
VQLEHEGEQVEFVALLDTRATGYTHDAEDISLTTEQYLDKFLRQLSNQSRFKAKEIPDGLSKKLELFRDVMIQQGDITDSVSIDFVFRSIEQTRLSSERIRRHITKICNAPIILFKATQVTEPEKSESFDWALFSKGTFTSILIDAHHKSMTQKNPSLEIASYLSPYLLK